MKLQSTMYAIDQNFPKKESGLIHIRGTVFGIQVFSVCQHRKHSNEIRENWIPGMEKHKTNRMHINIYYIV